MAKTKALTVGDTIPDFQLNDQDGQPFHVSSLLGKKVMVIYFYPFDHTPGCTKEACSFRDAYQDFQDVGAEVIGISSDGEKRHAGFASKYQLPFILLSDSKKEVRKAFGANGSLFGLLPGRVTYIIDLQGVIRYAFEAQFEHRKHVEEALRFIQTMNTTSES